VKKTKTAVLVRKKREKKRTLVFLGGKTNKKNTADPGPKEVRVGDLGPWAEGKKCTGETPP